jgi:hypothetical protein
LVLSQQLDGACREPPTPCEALAQSHVVFYGEVQEVTSQPYIVGRIWNFTRCDSTCFGFKALKNGPLLETIPYGSDGVKFEPKCQYLVFAVRRPGSFLIVGCTRTGRLGGKPDAQFTEMAEARDVPKTQ